ncbi:AaceriADL121Wp [[Ashbya] aceris (nom. inval.)]|nr:AaceriADL121Wp [[Ashbya] aceris (nom. inval.)]
MTRFVGCIDLHDGKVKQIVGGTLSSKADGQAPVTNFVSDKSPSYYAQLYSRNDVRGSHVIRLGRANDEAALMALQAAPGFLQLGGGVTKDNCEYWLQWASKVIVTSTLFDSDGIFQLYQLQQLSELCGRTRLVVDLSCRRAADGASWTVMMNKWQTPTSLALNEETLALLSQYCNEFLIHAADVEGLCRGIDQDLVEQLGQWSARLSDDIRVVYAGGANSIDDLALVKRLSGGRVDLTYGSALDIFGGSLVRFQDCCAWNRQQ